MSSLFIRSALFLLIVSSFIFSQTIHPSFGAEATTSTCVDTNITGLSSSGSSQGFPPSGVVDNNFNTLWSVFGKGSWIQLDLGSSKNICSVNIAWYKGDARQNNFVISTSTDGSTYKVVLTSKSAGNTLSYEKYQIPTTLARYVKITVNGNTQNNYASVTEVKAQTTTSSQPQQTQCTTTQVKNPKRSGSETGFPVTNAIDNNLDTRWSNNGKGSWIQVDIGTSKNICSVNIAWFKGNERQNNFVISTSKDGTTFTKVLTSKSSGNTLNLEKYSFPITNGRYVKVTVNGNTQNDYASITEIKTSTQNPAPTTPPSTGNGGTGDDTDTSDGVKMIYPTLSGGETWFFNPTNPNDGQFDRNGAEISKNSDGSWHLK
ncbi:MAG: discoidin domain-containing protein, partial [Nitrososphaeraceae archaeon]|nr:discoidin domain-containing protein [Nitrososphaeraceae archaeon]